MPGDLTVAAPPIFVATGNGPLGGTTRVAANQDTTNGVTSVIEENNRDKGYNLKSSISEKTARLLQEKADNHEPVCPKDFKCDTTPGTYQRPPSSSCTRTCELTDKNDQGRTIEISQTISQKHEPWLLDNKNFFEAYNIKSLDPSDTEKHLTIEILYKKLGGPSYPKNWYFTGKFNPKSFREEISKNCRVPRVSLSISHNTARLNVSTSSKVIGSKGTTILIGNVNFSSFPYTLKKRYMEQIEKRLKEFQKTIESNIEKNFGATAGGKAQDIFQEPKFHAEFDIPNPAYYAQNGDENSDSDGCSPYQLGCLEFSTNSNNGTLFSPEDSQKLADDIDAIMRQGPSLAEILKNLSAGAWAGIGMGGAAVLGGLGYWARKLMGSSSETNQQALNEGNSSNEGGQQQEQV